jgi:hypothetical protein
MANLYDELSERLLEEANAFLHIAVKMICRRSEGPKI